MSDQQVVRIVYTQSIGVSSVNQLSESLPEIYFQISRAAAYTGWFKQNFGDRRNGDFAVLVALGLHARPLIDDDLDLMIRLKLATPADRGRLYARVSDIGLADILGGDRGRIRTAANRVAARGLLRILPLPLNFRDSRGQYEGDRAYLLMGEQVLSQTIHRADLIRTVQPDRAALTRTVEGQMGGDRAALSRTKINTLKVNTLADASGALCAPSSSADNLSTQGDGNGAHLSSSHLSDEAGEGHSFESPVESEPEGHSSPDLLGRLNAVLGDPDAASAFLGMMGAIEQHGGLTAASFRAARIGVVCPQDRREQVLADMRRMQARSDLKPKEIRKNILAILTQNVGMLIGLGLESDGRRRTVPDRGDYAELGALAKEYGAERVWLAACDIAGDKIGGNPLDYLRAVLANRRKGSGEAGMPTSEDFTRFDSK